MGFFTEQAPVTSSASEASVAPSPVVDRSPLVSQQPPPLENSFAEHTFEGALNCSLETSCTVPSEPASNDFWVNLRESFSLAHQIDQPRVQAHIRWFVTNPDYITRVFNRGALYLPYIKERVLASGLPAEMVLLPVIESALDPFAYSPERASGLWQFIPATARLYQIKIDWWYDGRRDLIDSTDAAIQFLGDLGNRFDQDWLLALAAYNSGAGRVSQAIKRNQRQNKPTDFWNLHLPKETRNYVPKLLALSAIVANPAAFGIELPPVEQASEIEIYNLQHQIDLALAAKLADIEVNTLYRLNPGYNQWATHPDGPHRLVLPKSQIETMTDNLNALPSDQHITWRRHQIQTAETLSGIAEQYQLSLKALMIANDLNDHRIRAGDMLLVPTPFAASDTYSLSSRNRSAARLQRYESKYQQRPTRYLVKSGDSLWTIARQFKVTVTDLVRWNNVTSKSVLSVGDKLSIFEPSAPKRQAKASTAVPSASPMVRVVYYRVKSGDSLSKIAARFSTTVTKIKQWNPTVANNRYLQPGEQLTLKLNVRSAG